MPRKATTATIVASLLVSLTAALSYAADEQSGSYSSNTGSLPFESTAIELKDKKQDKDLRLRVTYPTKEGTYPIVIWSHGAMGSKDAYKPLVSHWASHGYVCIQPTHGDSLRLIGFKGLKDMNNVWNKWQSRTLDVKHILDNLDAIEAKIPKLRGLMDRKNIGMGGHSFGAHTSQLIGGVRMKNPVNNQMLAFSDPRPKCLLLVSPQGTGGGFVRESWKTLTRPSMVITGTKDKSPRTGKSYKWRREVYDYTPPGAKYLLMIDGAYHGFGGIAGKRRFPGSGPDNNEHVNYVKSAATAFLDAYLKDSKPAREFLRSNTMDKVSKGAAKLTSAVDD